MSFQPKYFGNLSGEQLESLADNESPCGENVSNVISIDMMCDPNGDGELQELTAPLIGYAYLIDINQWFTQWMITNLQLDQDTLCTALSNPIDLSSVPEVYQHIITDLRNHLNDWQYFEAPDGKAYIANAINMVSDIDLNSNCTKIDDVSRLFRHIWYSTLQIACSTATETPWLFR